MNNRFGRLAAGAATLAAAAMLLAAPALADGYRRGSVKDAKPEPRRCNLSANVALTTEYVFRGYSQTAEHPAIQGGFDATCGIFYAGLWASNLDWGGIAGEDIADIEIDWYLGIKPVTGKITWDLGVIYYTYPDSLDFIPGRDNNYVELKVGASTEVWKDGTVGLTVFYSPEYQYEVGSVVTVEGTIAQVLPKFHIFTPTISALLGYQHGSNNDYALITGNGDDHYWYWNVGLTLGFHEKYSLDFRYWDTSLESNAGGSAWCKGAIFQCDERFVATLKFTF
jgi:uncharacterized protein (TIGR02001 family)